MIITEEELRQLPPREVVAFGVRCAERVFPLVVDFENPALALKLAKAFCARQASNFYQTWNSIRYRNFVGHIRSLTTAFTNHATYVLEAAAQASYALHSQRIGEEEDYQTETPEPFEECSTYDDFYDPYRYSANELGYEVCIMFIVASIDGTIEACFRASRMMADCPDSTDAFDAAQLLLERMDEGILQNDPDIGSVAASKMANKIIEEMRRDYETLLANKASLLDENDPLGAAIDFENTDLFGPLWSEEPPLWFKPREK